jgi:membrane-bound serine protease (ClpP class)
VDEDTMMLLILLTLMGLLLLLMEVILPGFGIFGISGSIALILSFTLTNIQYGFNVFLMMFLVSLFFIAIIIYIAKCKKDKFVLNDTLKTQDFDVTVLQGIEEKQGITITTLQPYGTIEVEGKQIDVTSNEGYIEKNTIVQIVQVKGKTVIVKKVKED